jgi:hypothetical protein
VSPVPQHVISLDRKSYWDGTRWIWAERISPDGKWFWDGADWLPVAATRRSFWWPLIPPQWTNPLWWGTFAWVLPIVLFAVGWVVYFAIHHYF